MVARLWRIILNTAWNLTVLKIILLLLYTLNNKTLLGKTKCGLDKMTLVIHETLCPSTENIG